MTDPNNNSDPGNNTSDPSGSNDPSAAQFTKADVEKMITEALKSAQSVPDPAKDPVADPSKDPVVDPAIAALEKQLKEFQKDGLQQKLAKDVDGYSDSLKWLMSGESSFSESDLKILKAKLETGGLESQMAAKFLVSSYKSSDTYSSAKSAPKFMVGGQAVEPIDVRTYAREIAKARAADDKVAVSNLQLRMTASLNAN